jgi:hypothetical protein
MDSAEALRKCSAARGRSFGLVAWRTAGLPSSACERVDRQLVGDDPCRRRCTGSSRKRPWSRGRCAGWLTMLAQVPVLDRELALGSSSDADVIARRRSTSILVEREQLSSSNPSLVWSSGSPRPNDGRRSRPITTTRGAIGMLLRAHRSNTGRLSSKHCSSPPSTTFTPPGSRPSRHGARLQPSSIWNSSVVCPRRGRAAPRPHAVAQSQAEWRRAPDLADLQRSASPAAATWRRGRRRRWSSIVARRLRHRDGAATPLPAG